MKQKHSSSKTLHPLGQFTPEDSALLSQKRSTVCRVPLLAIRFTLEASVHHLDRVKEPFERLTCVPPRPALFLSHIPFRCVIRVCLDLCDSRCCENAEV